MNAIATAQGLLLRQIRANGPRLLGAERHEFRDSRGRSTPYLELGNADGETLVFLHGFSDRPEHFLATAALLARTFRILVPAMPGFGDGHLDVHANHSFEGYAAFMTEVLGAIAGERFHLMGNSLGGATALGVAAELGARVASLTLVDSAGVKPRGVVCVMDDDGNPFEVRSREDYRIYMGRVMHRANPALALLDDALFLEARANADWYARVGDELKASTHAFVARGDEAFVDVGRIAAPTFVVWGEEDRLFPHAIGSHLARTMPNAELALLPGVGHCPHLEAPLALARAFTRFHGRLGAR